MIAMTTNNSISVKPPANVASVNHGETSSRPREEGNRSEHYAAPLSPGFYSRHRDANCEDMCEELMM